MSNETDQFLRELKAMRWEDSQDYRDFLKEQAAKHGLPIMREIYPDRYPTPPVEPPPPSRWSRLMRRLSLIHITPCH